MFRNRTSSQKPGDEFIANFRQTFPEVGIVTSQAGSNSGNTSQGDATAPPNSDRYDDYSMLLLDGFNSQTLFQPLGMLLTLST